MLLISLTYISSVVICYNVKNLLVSNLIIPLKFKLRGNVTCTRILQYRRSRHTNIYPLIVVDILWRYLNYNDKIFKLVHYYSHSKIKISVFTLGHYQCIYQHISSNFLYIVRKYTHNFLFKLAIVKISVVVQKRI